MIRAWLTQHGFVLFLTLKRLISTPLTTLFSIIVMGIALSMPTGIYVFMKNLQSVTGEAANSPQMSLFLRKEINNEDIAKIKWNLEHNANIVSLQFVSKDAALQQLQQSNGLTDITSNLQHNPLPDAFVIHTTQNTSDKLEQLRAEIQNWPEVEHVQFDSAWLERLNALLKLGRFVVLMLAAILSVAIIAIMFNTIRLQILTKHDEIEISKLIGATASFIRRPFLYFGTIQGLASGASAWFIVTFSIELINKEAVAFTHLYGIDLYLQHLSPHDSISLIAFSALLGWLGARLSVASHLWQIEPQ